MVRRNKTNYEGGLAGCQAILLCRNKIGFLPNYFDLNH